jgi:hypothetical protein
MAVYFDGQIFANAAGITNNLLLYKGVAGLQSSNCDKT